MGVVDAELFNLETAVRKHLNGFEVEISVGV